MGEQPPPQIPPLGRGIPPPQAHLPRRLDSRAFGARRFRSFSFTTRTLIFIHTRNERFVLNAYLVLTLCGLALRSTRMTRPRVQRTSP